ncbi:phenoloxidase-activating factor 2-like [Drosophila hydei]|uniref:Phenoloxidase-activating factor 2 n=1 Tax=Drosophila hydei TaxID=7224 RepID=A0A6J2SWK8_DROHY|nr:phenoloxidase-activating factor 2-like [Drosophila hydei]
MFKLYGCLLGLLLATTQQSTVVSAELCQYPKVCVPRMLCVNNQTVTTDAQGVIGFRRVPPAVECEPLQKCCLLKNVPPIVTENHEPGLCGMRNPNGVRETPVKAQHDESKFGEFNWVVSVLTSSYCKSKAQICGYTSVGSGSLLTPRVVLTAAHILNHRTASELQVRAGEWDNQNEFEELPYQNQTVLSLITHEDFNHLNGYYDISILILRSPFQLNDHIGTICLPSPQANFELSRCTVTGWGKRKISDLSYPNIMKKIEMPFVDRDKCQQQLRDNTRVGQYFELHESFVCAGGEKDKDACFGDGGSPLVCPIANYNDRYQLVGLVSWGLHCGTENVPGVYTNVPMMVPWIKQQLNLRSITI